jgi:hypothetical protein
LLFLQSYTFKTVLQNTGHHIGSDIFLFCIWSFFVCVF